jgi:hypothetical protein
MATRGERYGTGQNFEDGVLISNDGNTTIADNTARSLSVVDATGFLILEPVKTVAPRGSEPRYGFDKNGAVVELGWLQKKKLYLIINNSANLVSDRVKAIDTRIADLTKDALLFAASVERATAADTHDKIYAGIPAVLAIAGIAIGGKVGGTIGSVIGTFIQLPNDNATIQAFTNKYILLNYELERLKVIRAEITGEYLQLDALGTKLDLPTAVRSSSSGDTLLWVLLACLFFLAVYLYIKSKQPKYI